MEGELERYLNTHIVYTSLSRLPFHSEETIKHILIKPAETVGDPPQMSFIPLSKTKLW